MSEFTISKERHIEVILNHFDFEKVHKIMKDLNWKWFGIGIPTVEDLKIQAEALLNDVSSEKYNILTSSTGGLKAIKHDDYLGLEFVITDFVSDLLNYGPEYERLKNNKIRKNKINKINLY